MTRPLNPASAPDTYHAVRFYDNDRTLATIVAQFLDDGFGTGHPGVVVAVPAQRAAIVRELTARSRDVMQLQRSGELLLLDAKAMLSSFMTTNGTPNAELFRNIMREVLNSARRRREDCTVRVYGQMVDILWQRGQHDAAISLEMLWNELATTKTFSLLCSYAMGHFYKEVDFQRVCGHHSHVVSADGRAMELAPIGEGHTDRASHTD